jgi:hypothetical protein
LKAIHPEPISRARHLHSSAVHRVRVCRQSEMYSGKSFRADQPHLNEFLRPHLGTDRHKTSLYEIDVLHANAVAVKNLPFRQRHLFGEQQNVLEFIRWKQAQ